MAEVEDNHTAVHPAMRKAIWQINTFGEKMIHHLREEIPNTGAGYNHASKNEPNWREAFWGSNLQQLQSLKTKYDPNNRLNCWHCVGYQGEEAPAPTLPPTSTPSTRSTPDASTTSSTIQYCLPTQSCWPNETVWNDFGTTLTGPLTKLQTSNYQQCEAQGDNAYKISESGYGICMQYHDCSKQFCDGNSNVWNIPVYSVEARNDDDIIKALAFAK